MPFLSRACRSLETLRIDSDPTWDGWPSRVDVRTAYLTSGTKRMAIDRLASSPAIGAMVGNATEPAPCSVFVAAVGVSEPVSLRTRRYWASGG
jgi:hypothetical protein